MKRKAEDILKQKVWKLGNLAGFEIEVLEAMEEYADQEIKDMHLNMQYYYEYIHMNGYITPQDWLENHKHF